MLPPWTMVASFSKACPQGSDVTSTFTPGFACSNLASRPFRNSVRGGLVITSVSLSVVSARAPPAASARPATAPSTKPRIRAPLPPLVLLILSRCRREGTFQIGHEILHALEPDMQPHDARPDPEVLDRVRPRRLLQRDRGRHHQALVP